MQNQAQPLDSFFAKMFYGAVPDVATKEDMQRWGFALIKIVSADGFSGAERQTLAALGRHLGATGDMVKEVVDSDIQKQDLAQLLSGFKDGAPARAMLYGVMTVASADGYSARERELAAKAAKLLGVEPNVLQTIEALFEAEMSLRKARAAVLFPNRRPE